MNTEENIKSVLVVLDYESASIDFFSLTEEEEQDIEKTLLDIGYALENIQYMHGKNIDSNISDVQEAISWIQTGSDDDTEL